MTSIGLPGKTRLGAFRAPLLTCALVSMLALLPVIRDPWFYFTDDAATQILPMWYSLGERVRAGTWPPLLDIHSWMGGNLAVEALFGVWNPVNAVLWAAVSLTPDLAISATIVRLVAFILLSAGFYGLCREYGAARWSSSAVATALPFCGSLFYYDAAKWPAALIAFVWIPFLWWAARRMVRDAANAWWVFVLGALALTAGNPYTTLAVCVVLLGLLIETGLCRPWRAFRRLALVSLAIACVTPLVYLPLLLSRPVTWRLPTAIGYSGDLTPHLRDLASLSIPGHVPAIPGVTEAAVYLCWFAMPLAAWLDWGLLRRRWRHLAGPLFVAGIFLLMARGPSELWMFRWPLRVLHYGYLGAAITLAVVLSAGLRVRPLHRRLPCMAGLVLADATIIAVRTHDRGALQRDMTSLCLITLLAAVAVWAYCHHGRWWLGGVLQIGTAITFTLQVLWFLGNHSVIPYYFPSSVTQARANFAQRYRGELLQVGDTELIGPPDGSRAAWRDLLPGNLYRPARVEALGSYSGMGFRDFAGALCMNYAGSTCPAAYDVLWRRPPGIPVCLADLLRLDTVAVQRKLVDEPPVPPGWAIAGRTGRVVILQRLPAVARTDGRLSWASPDVHVLLDSALDDRHELVRFDRAAAGPGRLLFARLAWPGYSARVGGTEAAVHEGPAGLLEVDLPPGVHSGLIDLRWRPPGLRVGVALAGVGAAIAILLGLSQRRDAARWWRTRRTGTSASSAGSGT